MASVPGADVGGDGGAGGVAGGGDGTDVVRTEMIGWLCTAMLMPVPCSRLVTKAGVEVASMTALGVVDPKARIVTR